MMGSQQNISFLVVDDFQAMRRAIKIVLNDLGYPSVTEAEDGNTALQLLEGGDFTVLITDWHMPSGMSGLELLRQVRAHARLAKLPVLMVTADAERAQVMEAMRAGVNDYIIKPFTTSTLRKKIETILLRKALRVPIQQEIALTRNDAPNETREPALLMDISLVGAGAVAKGEFAQVSDALVLVLPALETDAPEIPIPVIVRNIRPIDAAANAMARQCYYGLEFKDLSGEAHSAIDKIIEEQLNASPGG
jgi:two-component system, chemotaxis family, chemotaxis protein CheY